MRSARKKTVANTPVAWSWAMRTAALVAEALLAVLELVLVAELVSSSSLELSDESVAVGKEVAEVVFEDEDDASEAFSEPHSLRASLHFSCSSRPGERSMHCAKFAWQTK